MREQEIKPPNNSKTQDVDIINAGLSASENLADANISNKPPELSVVNQNSNVYDDANILQLSNSIVDDNDIQNDGNLSQGDSAEVEEVKQLILPSVLKTTENLQKKPSIISSLFSCYPSKYSKIHVIDDDSLSSVSSINEDEFIPPPIPSNMPKADIFFESISEMEERIKYGKQKTEYYIKVIICCYSVLLSNSFTTPEM